jgi:flagellar hook-length control protein FliK
VTTTSVATLDRDAQRATTPAQEPRHEGDVSSAVFAQLMRTLSATLGGGAGSDAAQNAATGELYDAVAQQAEVDPASGRDPASEAERRMREGRASPVAQAAAEERMATDPSNPARATRPETGAEPRSQTPTDAGDDASVGERQRRAIDDRSARQPQDRAPAPEAKPGAEQPRNTEKQGGSAATAPVAAPGASPGSGAANATAASASGAVGSVGAVRATTGTAPTMPGAVTPTQAKSDAAAPKPQAAPTPRQGNAALQAEAEAALGKVQRGLASLVNAKGGQMTLRLTPDALGEVRVHLKLRDGVVSARVEATQESARGLLEHGVDRLRAALEARGLKVDSLEVQQWTDPRGAEGARMDQHAARHEPGTRQAPQDAGTGWKPEGDAERRDDMPGEDRGRDDDGRHEAGNAGRDSGGAGPEGVPRAAEPPGKDGSAVRHGSARRLMVRLDTTV